MSKKNQQQQNQPELNQPTPTVLKRQELEALSDSELDKKYEEVFLTPGPEMTREQVIDALMAHTPNPGAPGILPEDEERDGKTYTSKETGKKYTVSGEVGKKQIVVRQVNVDMLNGSMIEVPNTETVQVYYKDQYDKLVESNFFSESKMKVEVLS